MQQERLRDGVRYVVEAYGPDWQALEERRKAWPGSRLEYDTQGLFMRDPAGRPRLTGPVWVLWRPTAQPPGTRPAPEPPQSGAPTSPPPARPSALPSRRNATVSLAATRPSDRLSTSVPRHPRGPDTPASRLAGRPGAPAALPATPRQRQGPRLAGPPTTAADAPAAPHAPQPQALPELEDPAEFLADPPPTPRPAVSPASAAPTPFAHMAGSAAHKNLTRVDRPARNLHGYHVRLGWKGAVYQKWFSDAAHGDGHGALAAALAWRDAKERELGKPRTNRRLKGRDATSNTGIVGVARVSVKGRPYYRALWRDADGRMRRRWFSVDELGEQQALRAAIAAHEEGVAPRLHYSDGHNH